MSVSYLIGLVGRSGDHFDHAAESFQSSPFAAAYSVQACHSS